jgi:biopolymer transport protein ExbB/TolQ
MLFDLLPTEISDDITSDSLDKFVDHIQGLPARSRISFLTNRVLRGLEHFRVLNSSSEVAGRLASQSDIDANSVESSYTLIKVFIWAIPILGFIGTVIGISSAVGSFSQTLESAQNIEAMKESLNNVTGGLATAFDTTLVALVMSMLVMFPVTSMQKSEEDLLNWVDEYCNENFLKRLKDGSRTAMMGSAPSSTEEVRKAINEAMIVHHAELQTWSKKLESVGSTITKHVAKGMTELEIKQQERHDKRISELRKTASTMTVQHQDVVQKIDAAREHLAATQSELAAHYKSLSESAATAQDQVAGSMQQSAQALHGYFANLHQGLTALNALLEQLGQKQVVVQMQAAEPQQRGRGWFGKRK